MNADYHNAVIERLVGSSAWRRLSDAEDVRRLLESWTSLSEHERQYDLSPIEYGPERFLELLDLALRCDYVNLADVEHRRLIVEIAERHRDWLQERALPTSLSDHLLGRLSSGAKGVEPQWQSPRYHAFASYLSHDEAVRRDTAMRVFVRSTNATWAPQVDLPFLLSPDAFAEAVVKSELGRAIADEALGGLHFLAHVQDLLSFAGRVA